jgi:prepilin-type N-terminal cleavage/methylation domain-containing protein
MPTSLVGTTNSRRGVTLLEMLIVMALMALVAGLSYPSVASGVDSLRLRSASDGIVGFLNTAIDRAERRQQVIQVWISPRDNRMTAGSPDPGFSRRFDLPDTVHILSVLPLAAAPPDEPRGFLFYPGGTMPPIGVEIVNKAGRRRLVRIDPITGVPRSELEAP